MATFQENIKHIYKALDKRIDEESYSYINQLATLKNSEDWPKYKARFNDTAVKNAVKNLEKQLKNFEAWNAKSQELGINLDDIELGTYGFHDNGNFFLKTFDEATLDQVKVFNEVRSLAGVLKKLPKDVQDKVNFSPDNIKNAVKGNTLPDLLKNLSTSMSDAIEQFEMESKKGIKHRGIKKLHNKLGGSHKMDNITDKMKGQIDAARETMRKISDAPEHHRSPGRKR